jgi:hypothetical protein
VDDIILAKLFHRHNARTAEIILDIERRFAAMRDPRQILPAMLVVRFFPPENQIQMLVDLKIASSLPIEQTDAN